KTVGDRAPTLPIHRLADLPTFRTRPALCVPRPALRNWVRQEPHSASYFNFVKLSDISQRCCPLTLENRDR
ncbi:MAG: hypothetical protein ACK4I8_09145, partial [Armatimonadota bacterium]